MTNEIKKKKTYNSPQMREVALKSRVALMQNSEQNIVNWGGAAG